MTNWEKQRQICEHNIDLLSPLSWFGKQTRNMDPVGENLDTVSEAEPCSFPMKAGQWCIMEKKFDFLGVIDLSWLSSYLMVWPLANLKGNTII